MDDAHFDAWTRRRFGLAAGGLAATILGLAGSEDAQTKKKKRKKKRCRKLGAECKPGGKRTCCGELSCCGPAGSETCSMYCLSDRNRKANFGSVDPADMLQRVRDLPISTWNYTSDDPAVRHVGPMAQDFAALFDVGEDDRHIHPLDGQGVALAAIQGLLSQLENLREENARLAARVARLETATWSSLLAQDTVSVARYRS